MPHTLNLLSAGAAQGLVKALQPAFEQQRGCRLDARFGAVGAMKEALLAGAFGFTTSRTPIHKAKDGELVPGTTADEPKPIV